MKCIKCSLNEVTRGEFCTKCLEEILSEIPADVEAIEFPEFENIKSLW